jgi:phenylacetate-CoA ligase
MMRNLLRTSHDLFSAGLYLPASRLLRLSSPARRPVMRHSREGLSFRQRSSHWDEEQKRRWILDRLRSTARRAYAETVYYRQLFDRIGFDPCADFSFDDYSKLPVLDREAIAAAGDQMKSTAIPPEFLQRESTGGSTGSPTSIWMGPEEKGWRESATESFMRRISAGSGTRTAMFWGHHLDPVSNDGVRHRWYSFATNVRWVDCFRLSPEKLERCHQAFSAWQPACIVAYASAIGALAEYVLERGYEPNYPTRCIVTGGERLSPEHRSAARAAFNRPLHERYGARDTGCIGFQMDPLRSLDFEVDWADVLVEPRTGSAESPILITKLHGDGMPMLRYRVGDLGRFPQASLPGHPVFSLLAVLGRELDRLWLPDGRWIHGIQIPHMMKDYPVKEFMLRQQPDYSVEIDIVPGGSFDEDSRLGILRTVGSNLPGINLTLRLVETIPLTRSSKRRIVVSDVEQQRRLAS